MSEYIITIAIIGITVVTSLLAFRDYKLREKLMYIPYLIKRDGQFTRFLSSVFIHGDFFHLFVNMFVLYNFGRIVETVFGFNNFFGGMGRFMFLGLYLLGGIAAGIPSYFKHRDHTHYRALGASGAVSAVLYSYILMFPLETLILFPIPIPIPAIIFGLLYLGYEFYASRRMQGDGIGHDAHFWGAVFGVFFTLALKPELGGRFLQEIQGALPG